MAEAAQLLENRDKIVGASPCCPDKGELRHSEPCHADYCDNCLTWHGEPWVEPLATGPTWQKGPDGKWLRPKHTLGPQIYQWCRRWFNPFDGQGDFRLTNEQLRFLYWFYAVDDEGEWVYREVTLQRIKGWGKDPISAVVALVEMVGPCRFSHWDADGNPVARTNPVAWIQVMGTALAQTKNTMLMLKVLASKQMRSEYGMVVGKEICNLREGPQFIEAVTSNPATLEGNRPSLMIGTEPHLWRANNDGHEMREVMDRNQKEPGARILWTTNAYNPSEESVGQANRESWEDAQAGLFEETGVMYDSLEAPENARLRPNEILPVLQAVRGDSYWVRIEAIRDRILDSRNSRTTSRRFYYNQSKADEEFWVDPVDVDATVHEQVRSWRRDPEIDTEDPEFAIKLGWALVDSNDPIVMFFDGGKSDDHTAVSGHRLSDGYTFAIGFWRRPDHLRKDEKWLAPRDQVDARVTEAMKRFNVLAFWADPSHAKDDETDFPYWDGLIDTWHRRWKDDLQLWSVKTGDRQHSIMWDMTSPARQQLFVPAAERFQLMMAEHAIVHCGHPAFVRYMKNARQFSTKWGTSLYKGSRDSKRKIDGAVTHVGASMLGQLALNQQEQEGRSDPAGDLW